jgi:hypothetical protein
VCTGSKDCDVCQQQQGEGEQQVPGVCQHTACSIQGSRMYRQCGEVATAVFCCAAARMLLRIMCMPTRTTASLQTLSAGDDPIY